jgi:transposase
LGGFHLRRYGLRDDQFARIEHLLPGRPGHVGRNSELGNRLFVEAVIWKFRSGAPWRDLPERFGDWKNIHTRFSRWAKSGVWESLFKTLADDPDNEYAMIDATIVRAHQHSAGGCKESSNSYSSSNARVVPRRLVRILYRILDDQTGTVPDLEAVNGAFALCTQLIGPRDCVLVRESAGQHIDALKLATAKEIASHDRNSTLNEGVRGWASPQGLSAQGAVFD